MRWRLRAAPPACCLTEVFIFYQLSLHLLGIISEIFSCVYGNACKIALDENAGSQYLKTSGLFFFYTIFFPNTI